MPILARRPIYRNAAHVILDYNIEGTVMTWIHIIWDYEPGGNVEHIADNGLTPDEVTHVLQNPVASDIRRSSGYPLLFGHTESGDYVAVVYKEIDEDTVQPITAFFLDEA